MLLNLRLACYAAQIILASGLVLLAGASARGQPSFPNSQPLSIIVGTPVGGGYDAYARLVGRHLGSALSGNPRIVVQNMPGAGSLIAANWLANSAPKDGTAIAMLPNATLFEALLGNSSARFDARKLNILGSLNDFTAIALVWHDTPFMNAHDLLSNDVVVGASAAASGNSVMPNILNSLVHTRFKVVNGYAGSAGIALALERGEVQAMVGDDLDFLRATRGPWLRDNKIRILMQATLTRHRDLQDVPTALELVSAENRDVLTLLIARQTYAGLFLAPPDVPSSIIADLREGFTKMTDDTDFQRDAQQSNLTIHAANAAEVTTKLGKLLASPQPVIDRASAELRRLAPN